VLATGPGDVAVRFDGAQLRRGQSLTGYITSGWVSGLDRSSVRPISLRGMPAANARAHSGQWDFDITVVQTDGQTYRFLTAAPTGSPALEATAAAVTGSFRQLSEAEKAALQPLRIHVVTVEPGKGIAALANEMQGTDRKLELFRLLNELPEGASLSVGQKVKIVGQ